MAPWLLLSFVVSLQARQKVTVLLQACGMILAPALAYHYHQAIPRTLTVRYQRKCRQSWEGGVDRGMDLGDASQRKRIYAIIPGDLRL
jgi:hypothetical protein